MQLNPSFKKALWIFLYIFLVWVVLIALRNWYAYTHPKEKQETSSVKKNIVRVTGRDSLSLPFYWKYHSGDDSLWGAKTLDDSRWDTLDPSLDLDSIPEGTFTGIGWFRVPVQIDSALTNKVMGFKVSHNGASAIYLDGKLLGEFGKVSPKPEEEEPYSPNDALALFTVQSPGIHVLAIRYSNHKFQKYLSRYEETMAGIRVEVLYAPQQQFFAIESMNFVYFSVTLLFGFFLTLSIVHFLLYLFYREQKQNLHYCIFTFTFSLIFLSIYLALSSTNPAIALFINHYVLFAVFLLLFSLIRLLHRLFSPKGARVTYLIAWLLAAVPLLLLYVVPETEKALNLTGTFIGIFCVFATVEFIRSVIAGLKNKVPGSKIIGTGALFFALFLLALMVAGIITGSVNLSLNGNTALSFIILVLAAIVSIPLSMSIYLAYDFSLTNRNLKKKLEEVEELSAQTIAQEKEKQEILSKQKETLEMQVKERTKEIVQQKQVIEEKNKDITDSINYAKRIQEALLSQREIKYKLFPDAFVLFQPKDVVSGDFYWFTQKNGRRLIAAVDCTGHGVPGAFMSMIGNTFLNEIVDEKGITQPDLILNELRDMIVKTLKQSGGESKDGMDIALLSFDDKNNCVEYAGANNPLWYIRDGVLTEVKPDKQPIGYSAGPPVPFTLHTIGLQKGDALYIFSDGYADQFGGEKGKKFKYKQLGDVFLSIHQQPMLKQEEILLDTFHKWKGSLDQIDDVLVIGVRI